MLDFLRRIHTPDGWAEFLEQVVRRDFKNNIRDKEDDQTDVILISREVEVLLKGEQAGIGDVDSVQECQDV